MKHLFLDTEFNGFGGELISMALVADDGREFYAVRAIPQRPDPWVAVHVLPLLDQEPVGYTGFLIALEMFLQDYNGCTFIADWPADIEHLCAALDMIGAATDFILPIECTMKLVNSPKLFPKRPHNALSDAWALRDWYLESSLAAMPRPAA